MNAKIIIIICLSLVAIFSLSYTPALPVDFIYIDGGTFQMGDEFGDGFREEMPVHAVSVNSFYFSKYEVTQQLWNSIMESNPSSFKGDNRPVEEVSWYDAVEFCNRYSMKLGLVPCYQYTENGVYYGTDPKKWPDAWNYSSTSNVSCNWTANGFRLPTEAEWEYAAKGGKFHSGFKYSGSNDPGKVTWFLTTSGGQTHDIGQKQANALGLFDMSGNVWEWCWDWFNLYPGNTDKISLNGAQLRVLRGGAWNVNETLTRVSIRGANIPYTGSDVIGFRLAVGAVK